VAITTSEIENCLVNEEGFDCEKAAVLTFPVAYGEEVTLELVSVSTIQKNGEPTALEETIEIATSKSQPRVRYPLSLLHTVPYFPYEEVICEESGECVDGADAAEPTCGWTYQGSYKIEDSQGYCNGSEAHCMRLGELYFHGYEIGRPATLFQITGDVKKGDQESAFVLTPASQVYKSEDPEMKAELAGELAGYQEIPDLSNYILYIPSSPDTHVFVQDYQNNMLLVPREEVSFEGGDCDKVGVSFHTFREQEAKSNTREIGDCLHNQLFHKHNSDLQKLMQNPDAETTYLVHGKKIFKGSMEFKQGMEKILEYRPASSDEKSLVAITTNFETVKVVETESIGIIVVAYVETFESMSKNGTMVVEVQNYGDLKTDYIVNVTECNNNINEAIPQQSVTLYPAEIAELKFDINSVYNLDSSNECLASLKSATGRLYDEVFVKFDTTKHQSRYSWDLLEKNEAGDGAECVACDDSNGDGICDVDDNDNDGVANDSDACPATPPGSAVDASGCAIAELCPCDSPDWKNHGQYVLCVAREAKRFSSEGLITRKEKRNLVFTAARSGCGKKK
jgi:hypothetical protein